MVVKSRRKGARSWARGTFAILWIALGGLSSLYLFTLFNDPTALGAYSVARGVSIPSGTGPLSASQAAALKESLAGLSKQMVAINTRLDVVADEPEPDEAASTPAPDTTPHEASEPDPVAEAEQEPVEMVAVEETEIVEPEAAPVQIADADPVREPEPLPVREPEPLPEPQLTMPDPAPVVEAEPTPPVVVGPPALVTAPLVAEPLVTEPVIPDAAPVPSAEIAILDPAILPRTANDGSTRYAIELGTVSKRDGLRPLWRELLTEHAALVAGLQPRRIRAPDKKWRLIAGPFSNVQDAEGACSLFKKAGRKCAATVYAGDAL